MASYYTRRDSPFYWLKTRDASGNIVATSSGVRVDSPGSIRKVQMRVAKLREKEARIEQDGRGSALASWVPPWIEAHYVNEGTKARAYNAWAWLATFLALRKVSHPEEVSYLLCQDYMAWRTDALGCHQEGRRLAKWNTALVEIRYLGAIMQEALRRGLVAANPCARLGLGHRDTKEKSEITASDQATIEKALLKQPQWMRDSWLVGIKQGCRVSAVGVPMHLIDEAAGTIQFRQKGGKFHTAPLHADLLPLVARRREEGAKTLVDMPPGAPRQWWDFFRTLGMEYSFHCLRVSVITRLARANVSEAKAMQYIGHCNSLVHAIYRKLKAADVSELGKFL